MQNRVFTISGKILFKVDKKKRDCFLLKKIKGKEIQKLMLVKLLLVSDFLIWPARH